MVGLEGHTVHSFTRDSWGENMSQSDWLGHPAHSSVHVSFHKKSLVQFPSFLQRELTKFFHGLTSHIC